MTNRIFYAIQAHLILLGFTLLHFADIALCIN